MSFKNVFCASPWFHMRIANSGKYEFCRWSQNSISNKTVANESVIQFFQKDMAPYRRSLLNGAILPECTECYEMEKYQKVSGRQRQLLKIGITDKNFESSLASSTFRPAFDYSAAHNGETQESIQDWQINLGNYCNSACIMCSPGSSSQLSNEFFRLKLIDEQPDPSWCANEKLLNKFCTELVQMPAPRYIHFIGGETIITPGFKKILRVLVDCGLANNITIGFTTNLTVWETNVIDLLKNFNQVNVGLSIETFSKLNDYVRYPSQIDLVNANINRWVSCARENNWLVQLRPTPNCLTIHELTTVLDYAWQHKISVESCNFLTNPKFMKISVLPTNSRQEIAKNLQAWTDQHQQHLKTEKIINTRSLHTVQEQIHQYAVSYIEFLERAPDESFLLPDLVKFLKQLESGRKNSILDYIPDYEKLFRSAGY